MTQRCRKYTEEVIGQFVDNELDQTKAVKFSSHLEHCPDCRIQVEKLQKLGAVFNHHATAQISRIRKTTPLNRGTSGIFARLWEGMTHHLYIKLASLTAVAIFVILSLFQGDPSIDPSAIVKSLDTNASSVMIIETQNEKHTIIWFSET